MLKTSIFIDGYNLYYSRLKGTQYKWLDVVALFRDHVLPSVDSQSQVVAVKYFTAPIKSSYARHGKESAHAQVQYLRALASLYPGLIQIIQGFHVLEPTELPTHALGTPPSKAKVSPVWKIEEKQTDVNIALHAYRDVMQGVCDQIVVCSNDSDMEPALSLICQDKPAARIGLVLPLRENTNVEDKYSNKRLTVYADWVRHQIRDNELLQSQLPNTVPTKTNPARKPLHW